MEHRGITRLSSLYTVEQGNPAVNVIQLLNVQPTQDDLPSFAVPARKNSMQPNLNDWGVETTIQVIIKL